MESKIALCPIIDDALLGLFVFSDDFGVGRLDSFTVDAVRFKDEKEADGRNIFVPTKGARLFRAFNEERTTLKDIRALLRKGVYRYKKNYYARPPLIKGNLELAEIDSISIGIHLSLVVDQSNALRPHSYNVEITNLDELNKVQGIPLGLNFSPVPIALEKLHLGDEIFYLGRGRASISRIANVIDGPICEVTLLNGDVITIGPHGINSLVYLPYEKHENEFDILSVVKENIRLSARLIRDQTHGQYTLYWLPIEEAARYVVSLFAIISPYGQKRLYPLQDIEIERGKRYLCLPHLSGEFVCKVMAEDRAGNKIAISQALKGTNN